MDGKSFDQTVRDNNLEAVIIEKVNARKEDEKNKKIISLSNNLFNKIYNLKSTQIPEIINIDSKYYIAEISKIEKKNSPIDDS